MTYPGGLSNQVILEESSVHAPPSLAAATFHNFRERILGIEERAVEFRERPLPKFKALGNIPIRIVIVSCSSRFEGTSWSLQSGSLRLALLISRPSRASGTAVSIGSSISLVE